MKNIDQANSHLTAEFIARQKERIKNRIQKYSDTNSFKENLIENGDKSPMFSYIVYKNNKVMPHLQRALERIKKGSYGICIKCQKTIELKRLEKVPAADKCIECVKKN